MILLLHGYIFDAVRNIWSTRQWAVVGDPLPHDTSSFLLEALALEAAFDLIDGLL